MADTAFEIRMSSAAEGAPQSGSVFLCHNSRDKPDVKRIADALELEFGTAFFLDAYAIPTGEAFLPWIERALANASGVAVFLGANGWGPTHLWEAERALSHYRENSSFKVIPVTLPGIRQEDMQRLGSGKVFQEINWADFSKDVTDRDSLEKLEAALSGRSLPQHRGPARLTPYQIRRDAERWSRSGATDRSILYTGAQLDAAMRLIDDNPDFVVVDEVTPFLNAAQRSQKRFWRRVAVGSIATAFALAGLTLAAGLAYRLAEQRRVASSSRQLAIGSREASGMDRRLLMAAQAVVTSPTPEAKGALLERLQDARYLKRFLYADHGVEAVVANIDGSEVFVATRDGRLSHAAGEDRSLTNVMTGAAPSGGAPTALTTRDGVIWLGRDNGQVEVLEGTGPAQIILPPGEKPAAGRDLRVRSLVRQANGPFLAIGTGSGRLAVVDTRNAAVRLDLDEGEDERITALAFDPTGQWLAAGTASEQILLLSLADFTVRQCLPKLGGSVLALDFTPEGQLIAVTSGARLATFKWNDGEFQSAGIYNLPAMLTAAAISAPNRKIAVGDGSGAIWVYDLFGLSIDLGVPQLHANSISSVAFSGDGHTLVSAASDGTVALLDIQVPRGVSTPVESFGPDASILRTRGDGTLVAAFTLQGRAGVWRRDAGGWKQEIDLIEAAHAALGGAALDPPTDTEQPPPGFEAVDEEIPAVVLDAAAGRVAWSTRRGAILWHELSSDAAAVVVDPGQGAPRRSLSISADGQSLAVIENEPTTVTLFGLSGSGTKRQINLPGAARSVALDATGSRIVAGLEDGRAVAFGLVRNWAALDAPVKLQEAAIAGIAFAPGGRLVSFGSGGGGADRSVVVADADSLAPIRRLQIRQAGGSVAALDVGEYSGLLAVADQDGQVLLWDLNDLRFIAELKAGSTVVPGLHIDDKKQQLFAYSSDGSFTVWDLDPERWLSIACAKANRNLRSDEWTEILPDYAYAATCSVPGRLTKDALQ